MGILSFSKAPDINAGYERFLAHPGALLVDVRNRSEYSAGHIPGSCNIPLHRLEDVEDLAPDRSTPLYVYCLSGGRSSQALAILQEMGYDQAINIGGIRAYKGKLEE